jgi:predicted DNA-binding transcriptional regulator YafY
LESVRKNERQKAILLLLHTRGRMRAADLAGHFHVAERTIYRDVKAIVASGTPVVGTPGVGYTLPDTPAVLHDILALDQADAVRLSGFMAATESAPPFHKARQTALLAEGVPRPSAEAPLYLQLRYAVAANNVTALATHDGDQVVWPLALLRLRGVLVLVARDPARGKDLAVPLEVVRGARVGPAIFAPPEGFTIDAWVPRPRSGQQVVRVWTDPVHAALERHRAGEHLVADYEHQGRFVMVYHVGSVHDVWPRLMGYGGWFQVLHPPALRRTVARAAQHIESRHR